MITHTSWISTNNTRPKTVSSDITNTEALTMEIEPTTTVLTKKNNLGRIKRNMANQAMTKVPEVLEQTPLEMNPSPIVPIAVVQPQQSITEMEKQPSLQEMEEQKEIVCLHKYNFAKYCGVMDFNPNNTTMIWTYLSLWKNTHNCLVTLMGLEKVTQMSLAPMMNLAPAQSTSNTGPNRNHSQKPVMQPYLRPAHIEEESNNMQNMLSFSRAYYRAMKGINKNNKKGKNPQHKNNLPEDQPPAPQN
ncbi:hypothetical protein CROQUDRAFT_659195 [Cronartium quercuum f. sp. fusiforme G11]|uniref:Uncharacterized protein n=1 Tax=Cronartium quercuum f. sp. fusiforme G11 TaxID=708437 RepID=A0A9P6NJ58_9BASI|nr:hypothetical protein CROQUDRAFT_659195 [Cronartium quercuum f. sp. fusiforme G11]